MTFRSRMPTKKKPSKKSRALVVKKPLVPAVMGRPTRRTPEIIDYILEQTSKGRTLTSICEEETMPQRRTFFDWMEEDSGLSALMGRARDIGCDAIAEDCMRIADFSALDTLISEKTGNPQADSEWIARSRLRVDTRMRLIAKWRPKKYGDKVEVDLSAKHDVVVRIGKPNA